MEKPILITLLLLIVNLTGYTQVTKLPTYAIRVSYPIDNIKDTIAPKAGGTIKAGWDITKDSVILHYNDQNLIILEQVFRKTSNSHTISYPDTSRFYRKYIYDNKDRLISIQHWIIVGSPHPSSPYHFNDFPYGALRYQHAIQRIDSMAYDSHDRQIFYRRYEAYDFYNYNFSMVIKEGWENEYKYDELGRLSQEGRFYWTQNTRYRKYDNPFNTVYTHTYHYEGNSSRIKSRNFYAAAPGSAQGFIPASDSLFKYDTAGRIVSSKSFPYYTPSNGTDYSKPSLLDTIVYLNNSIEYSSITPGMVTNIDSKQPCGGRRYDNKGRLLFLYNGSINAQFEQTQYSTCKGIPYTIMSSSRLHHYTDDNKGNLLATDSAYLYTEYTSGYTYSSNVYFDTIAYGNFKIIDTPTTVIDKTVDVANTLTIYPNPAETEVTIASNDTDGTLDIWGIDGKIWLRQEVKEKTIIVNIANLQTGLYIVELNGQRKKLIVK